MIPKLRRALLGAALALMPSLHAEHLPAGAPPAAPSPFGIAWFFLYGTHGVPAATFMPQVRELGGDFTKVYLFWQQIEPEPGRYDWTAVDAFLDQLHSPEEGLVSLFTASQWATVKPSSMLPPSPAKDLDAYYRFVFETVKHCRGRVRYWQNDAEPNNPIYWAGTKEQFVEHLKVFSRAVKAADPAALVVVGGYDGLFVPPGMKPLPGQKADPFPHQEVGLQFFDHVLQAGADAFDVFDLRLYGDPYSIVERVEYMRGRMRAMGYDRPMICTEYGGPGLFEFKENHRYIPLVTAWSQSMGADGTPAPVGAPNPIADLYANRASLAPQTQMFMQGCAPELDAKYQRIQARSLVMRNLFALSAGIERTLYWELVAAPGRRDDLMNLMYGKIGLLGVEGGELKQRTTTAEAFARMTKTLAGVRAVKRVTLPDQPGIFLFEVDCGKTAPVYVVWERRDQFSGEDAPPVTCRWPTTMTSIHALDALGAELPAEVRDGMVQLPVGVTPVYVKATP
jgi:hypothetical protein